MQYIELNLKSSSMKYFELNQKTLSTYLDSFCLGRYEIFVEQDLITNEVFDNEMLFRYVAVYKCPSLKFNFAFISHAICETVKIINCKCECAEVSFSWLFRDALKDKFIICSPNIYFLKYWNLGKSISKPNNFYCEFSHAILPCINIKYPPFVKYEDIKKLVQKNINLNFFKLYDILHLTKNNPDYVFLGCTNIFITLSDTCYCNFIER